MRYPIVTIAALTGLCVASCSAATITALATVNCDEGGVITTDSTATNGLSVAACGSGVFPGVPNSPYARSWFSNDDYGVQGQIGMEPNRLQGDPVTRFRADLSVEWTGDFVVTGGTGLATVDVSHFGDSISGVVTCQDFRVDGAFQGCPSTGGEAHIDVEFNVPFTVTIRLRGSGSAFGPPGYSVSGFSSIHLSQNAIRQGGLLVSGASLTAVPEPATMALTGLGIGLVFLRRRR